MNILQSIGITPEQIKRWVVKVEQPLSGEEYRRIYRHTHKTGKKRKSKHNCPYSAKSAEYRKWLWENIQKPKRLVARG